jgi:predicted dehydrogenase
VSPIKVGLVGGGGIVDAHIRGYRAYAEAIEVVAVADLVSETVQRRATELGAAAYTDFRQMILEADLDAVDICLPHHLHAEAIVAAAEAGKHILCEKPLCLTVQQAELVQRAVSVAGVTLMCAHNQLYLPAVAKASNCWRTELSGLFTKFAPPIASTTTSTRRTWVGARPLPPVGAGS